MTGRKDQISESIDDEALRWFVLLHSGHATDHDRAEHAKWISVDASHLQAYMRLGSIWSDMDALGDPRKRNRPMAGRPRLSRRAILAGGASAAALGIVGYQLPLGAWLSDYSTGTGEQKTVQLADGSTASLDADTSISLDFTDRQRSIRLIRGRAYFDVAKDSSRPFVVHAKDGRTTALGTRFLVHQWDDSVTVSVEESAVAVVAPDRSQAVVHQGQDISYALGGGVSALETADLDADTAWRRGKLIFQNRPLGQVVSDVNRYRSGMIRIMDAKLRTMRISGIFDINHPDGVLDAITSALPVRPVRLTKYVVLLLAA
ncbi:FecR family protein [Neorhizobium sp. NCHU2750]|uniref:FecR family protein n=1 Tax=Neorhizobium sp. NCHU2750 TaxID=1825976 RepID=UPI000E743D9D|nr:transmembrane sensor [Neorhizobium sp. NCHU2750]